MQGIICVLNNPIFPEHLTIRKTTGLTARDCIREIQAESISVQNSELRIVYEKLVSDCDKVEKAIYNRLGTKRQKGKRDKFNLAASRAVDVIEKTILELVQSGLIKPVTATQTSSISNREWWDGLTYSWKNILKSSIEIVYQPTEDDILRGIHNAIDNTGNKHLRAKISKLIIDRNYTKRLSDWYSNLGHEMPEFNWYLPYELSDEELDQVINLTRVDCRNSYSIDDLKPTSRLKSLQTLNCSNTSIYELSALSGHPALQDLTISYTAVSSLASLRTIKSLQNLVCNNVELSNNQAEFDAEVDELRHWLPDCQVIYKPFLTVSSSVPVSSTRKRGK